MGGHVRHLGEAFLGEVQGDVDAGHVTRGRNEAVDQQGLVQGGLANLLQDFRRLRQGVGHQVGHEQVVADRTGVLEVGDRVDANGKGDLPRLFGQVFHRRQHRGGEDVAAGRRQDEQHVVVLAVHVLQVVEGLQLRVLVAEKSPVIRVEPYEAPPAGGNRHQQDGGQHDGPAPADHPPGVGLYGAVESAVFRHGGGLRLRGESSADLLAVRRAMIHDNPMPYHLRRRP